MKAYRHLERGDHLVCKSPRGPNALAYVMHISSGGEVYVTRWNSKTKRWCQQEKLSPSAYMSSITKEEFLQRANT